MVKEISLQAADLVFEDLLVFKIIRVKTELFDLTIF